MPRVWCIRCAVQAIEESKPYTLNQSGTLNALLRRNLKYTTKQGNNNKQTKWPAAYSLSWQLSLRSLTENQLIDRNCSMVPRANVILPKLQKNTWVILVTLVTIQYSGFTGPENGLRARSFISK